MEQIWGGQGGGGWDSPSWYGMLCLKGQEALLKGACGGLQGRPGARGKGQSQEAHVGT